MRRRIGDALCIAGLYAGLVLWAGLVVGMHLLVHSIFS
jgi:hypothetical protein